MNDNLLAIVTGGTRGIGAAISIALHNAGYDVVANYANNETSANEFSNKHGIKSYKWDVSSFDECAASINKIEQDLGKQVSILINNAGITRDSMMHKMQPTHWHEVIDTNLSSCFNMSYACINNMRNNQYGRIVNISSINGLAGQAGQTNYAAAKAGVIGFTKSLAKESASKNITVNAIAPGYVETEMTAKMPQEILDKIIKNIPIGRMGKPEEIANTVLFLINKNSSFITGETISINGGQYMI
jgi:acetoacetyl-CoA reductase